MELLDETTIKFTYTGGLMSVQTSCLGALYGEQSLTLLNRHGTMVSKMTIVVTTVRRRPIVPLGQRCSVNLLTTK